MAEKKHPEMEQEECHCEETCDCEHDETCDCGCEDDVVMLEDENGKEIPFHYVYNLEHEGKEYAFLQSTDEEEYLEIFEIQTVEENGEMYDMLSPVDDKLYDVLYEKLMLVASEDCCEDDDCDCHEETCDCEHHHDKK